jgi:hypothetical protein
MVLKHEKESNCHPACPGVPWERARQGEDESKDPDDATDTMLPEIFSPSEANAFWLQSLRFRFGNDANFVEQVALTTNY